MVRWASLAVAGCVACSGGDGTPGRGAGNDGIGAECVDGEEQACTCDDGKSGTRSCASGWGACDCSSSIFDNPDPIDVEPTADAGGGLINRDRLPNCDPGFYLGTYSCTVMTGIFATPLMGDVSFSLEIDETAVNTECDSEFCPDLVISESSGILFGLAGFIGFEAKLEGGLDCTTGVFRASAPNGIWGNAVSSNPNDPNAPWTVQQPPTGMFDGTLMGMHLGGSPQAIEGSWDLMEVAMGSQCAGPFTVELQP